MSTPDNAGPTGSAGAATGDGAKGTPAGKKSDKDVDLVNACRGVWLVNVPKYIADRWENCPENSNVGKLKIARRTNATPVVSFSLDDSVIAATPVGVAKGGPSSMSKGSQKEIPKEHKFVVNTLNSQTLAVLSHSSAAGSEALTGPGGTPIGPVLDKLAVEGKVVQRAECRPINNHIYMSLKKEAYLKAIEPTRQTKHLDKAVMAYKPKANHAVNIANDLKKKSEGKKSRDDKEKVMETLFALFEKHQYYNIKDLVKETRQPVTYLKEILKEVCNYNLKNPHKNMWELKPEYRHYKGADEDADDPKPENSDSSDDDD
ncbi:hypothetical protein TCAL_06459 [Tigriopus californicus]|uniref:General transcription factor IIF subunit 2 n=1 Tax=Tigriopus californicus TaxID=6832 RepID=A0A553PLN7_TIGCA|nr:general transcription factor IIF subunit 2-like [Tigriopus californicus]TRY78595.1 hypothetical protein TCAL_06459 [Tigriopus californicus]|eukprot:TCALIF_06459-PA protein Name:"Similar to TfIIFbeta General transcription factor IIF subunit 2 (Drosophila melanogaster)" AED:0.24 eAED:0.24 QI:0/-1/0/1/-1/1/1/0/316